MCVFLNACIDGFSADIISVVYRRKFNFDTSKTEQWCPIEVLQEDSFAHLNNGILTPEHGFTCYASRNVGSCKLLSWQSNMVWKFQGGLFYWFISILIHCTYLNMSMNKYCSTVRAHMVIHTSLTSHHIHIHSYSHH